MEVSQIDNNYNGALIAIDDVNSDTFNLIVDPVSGELLMDTDDISYIIQETEVEPLKIDQDYFGVFSAYDETNNIIKPLICADSTDGTQTRTMSLLCECDNSII